MSDIHLLTPPGPDLRQCTVVCGARLPERGTWHRALVTCPRCLEPSRQRTSRDPMPERELQELVRQAATRHGWLYFHVWNSRHSPSGFPDVVAIREGRLIAAELKRAGQEPTPAQTRWLEAFRQVQSVEVYTWRPDDLAQMLKVLR